MLDLRGCAVTSDDKKNPSRLERQWALLGLSDQAIPEGILRAEQKAQDEAVPRPLVFPDVSVVRPRKAPFLRRGLPVMSVLAAASVAFLLWREGRSVPPALQVMGAGDVQVFTEKDGRVQALAPDANLGGGTRVKATVLAVVPSTAFWGVVAADGRLLSDANWIAQNRLDLPAGERRSFNGSLALDGPSEGEALVVVSCPKEAAPDMTAVVRGMVAPKVPDGLQSCRFWRFRLRE